SATKPNRTRMDTGLMMERIVCMGTSSLLFLRNLEGKDNQIDHSPYREFPTIAPKHRASDSAALVSTLQPKAARRGRFWHNDRMDAKIFARRRERLMQHMGAGVAILPTAPMRVRNRDVHYTYRSDS